MTLAEIESKIAALKKRYEELDAKSCKAGVWDGVVMSAMSAVDDEIKRLNVLREKALVSDLVARKPGQTSEASSLPLPYDFESTPGDEIDPLEGLDSFPEGAAGVEVRERLFSYMMHRTAEYIGKARDRLEDARPVAYTQGQHFAVMAMFARIQTEYRLLSAFGRDKRNAVEKKLLERIAALENRASDLTYRGVWKADVIYRPGNFVTDGGSLFHTNRACVGERPGSSDAFTLAVKKGRDAKS